MRRRHVFLLLSFIFIIFLGLYGCSGNGSTPEKEGQKQTSDSKHQPSSAQQQSKSKDKASTHQNHTSSHSKQAKKSSSESKDDDQSAAPIQKRSHSSIDATVKNMTLDEKIGQMMMVGIDGRKVDAQTRKMIRQNHVGGVILFSKNISTPDQTVQLTNQLKQINAKADNPLPMFMSVDEEGGEVSRMPDAFHHIPSSGKIGTVEDPKFSREIGKYLGKQLKALGLNMDFAPVLDVNEHPGNSVIGNRSFGSDKQTVSQLGIATMKGIYSQHVISAVKHFPGYGAVTTDAHTDLPVVGAGRERLKDREWYPYQKAIHHGADTVMVTHILLKKVDSQQPASLSKKVITGELRHRLDFNGVVISDDLTMGAIKKRMPVSKAAVQAIKAGSDIAMVAFDTQGQSSTFVALKKAVKTGEISKKQVDQSVKRIINLKQKYKLSNHPADHVNVGKLNGKIQSVLNEKF